MAASDWTEIYQTYETQELVALQAKLKKEAEHSFTAQGVGSKNYQKSLMELRDKLQAITRVLNLRSGDPGAFHGVADFSGV